LGREEAVHAEVPYPQELAGVTVTLSAVDDGTVLSAYLVSAAAGQIVVPSEAAADDYTVTASYGGETSNAFNVTVADANFGVITNTNAAGGLADARILPPVTEPAAVTYVNGATPGATLEFSAAGLATTGEPDNEYPAEANLIGGAVLLIGGQEAALTYIGRDPARPGYNKILVTLPATDLPLGSTVMFQLRFGETTTTAFSIPITAEPATPCENTIGISAEGLQTLAHSGDIVRGGMSLARVIAAVSSGNFLYEIKSDQFSGGFVSYTAQAIAAMKARSQFLRDTLGAQNCTVFTPIQADDGGVYVDAGDTLALAGPTWTLEMPRTPTAPNVYSLLLAQEIVGITIPPQPGALNSPFVAGRYSLDGPGGAVVGPFSKEIDVSEQFVWTNGPGLNSVDPNNDLILTWTGGAPDDMVQVGATVRGFAPEDLSKIVDRVFQCSALPSAGQIVIPSTILMQMPIFTSQTAGGPGNTFSSTLSVAHTSPWNDSVSFEAPLVAGGNTASAALVFGYTYARAPVLFP